MPGQTARTGSAADGLVDQQGMNIEDRIDLGRGHGTFQHQVDDAPDVDLRDRTGKLPGERLWGGLRRRQSETRKIVQYWPLLGVDLVPTVLCAVSAAQSPAMARAL